MTIPTYQELMRPVLAYLEPGEVKSSRAVVEAMAAEANLTAEEVALTTASGGGVFHGRVHWAITYLAQGGAVVRPLRGHVQITDFGRRVLAAEPVLNNQVLRSYPEFHDFYERIRLGRVAESEAPHESDEAPAEASASPDELIAEAMKARRATIESELLTRARELEPGQFELLVLRLLKAMGYGTAGSIEHSGKSGDGGIDGIISQDPLGLDRIYLQAKKYAADNVVQRPAIQGFVGALMSAQGDRGVFITTSRFSEGAHEEARKVGKRIELIDGDRLTRLMVDYGVGVQPETVLTLHRIDEDFFEELS